MTKTLCRFFLCMSFVACADATPSDQLMAKAAELDLRGEANLQLVEEVCSDDFDICSPDDDRAARIFECGCDSAGTNCGCCYSTNPDSIGMCCSSTDCAGTP